VRTIREQKDVFGARSLSKIIPDAYAVDVDGPEDLKKAEWFLASGHVVLPHLGA
jgi:hypothetical protein